MRVEPATCRGGRKKSERCTRRSLSIRSNTNTLRLKLRGGRERHTERDDKMDVCVCVVCGLSLSLSLPPAKHHIVRGHISMRRLVETYRPSRPSRLGVKHEGRRICTQQSCWISSVSDIACDIVYVFYVSSYYYVCVLILLD